MKKIKSRVEKQPQKVLKDKKKSMVNGSFTERQNSFLENKKKRILEGLKKIEVKEVEGCTFKP